MTPFRGYQRTPGELGDLVAADQLTLGIRHVDTPAQAGKISRGAADTLGSRNLILADFPKIMNIRRVEHERGAGSLTRQPVLPVGLLVTVVVRNESRDDLPGRERGAMIIGASSVCNNPSA